MSGRWGCFTSLPPSPATVPRPSSRLATPEVCQSELLAPHVLRGSCVSYTPFVEVATRPAAGGRVTELKWPAASCMQRTSVTILWHESMRAGEGGTKDLCGLLVGMRCFRVT